MSKKRQATSKDVAKLAGVSQPTVSRAFDPDSPVAAETRARILAAAAEVGYQPNEIARTLLTNQSNVVGVVMANVTTSLFYPQVLEQLTAVLQNHGKQTLLFNLLPEQPIDDILPKLQAYQVDGLILTSTTPSNEAVNQCIQMGTPVVLFNRVARGSRAHAVCCDHEAATRLLAQRLLAKGYRRIAFAAGAASTDTNRLRQAGLVAGLSERSASLCATFQDEYSYEAGRRAAQALLSARDRPEAVVCAADIIALGFIDEAREKMGLRIPEDVGVAGFDDIPPAGWPAYGLTTVRQPIEDMVKTAVSLLLNPPTRSTIKRLPGKIIERYSLKNLNEE